MKAVPLPLAKLPGSVRGTKEERAARVQAHMDRVHPMVDAIRREEAVASLHSVERRRVGHAKERHAQYVRAKLRAEAIAAKGG